LFTETNIMFTIGTSAELSQVQSKFYESDCDKMAKRLAVYD